MVESHCEVLWVNNTGAGFGHHPTSYYGAAEDVLSNQAIITRKRLRYKILVLCINNFLTTDAKFKLRYLKTSYTFNNQYDGDTIFLSL